METTVKLKDGSEVLIRPMTRDDLERSFAFFQTLPEEDREFLRVDVSKRRNVERRIQWMEEGWVKRLVAVSGDDIVADGALELAEHEWKEHTGEFRLVVARPYQRKGLGMHMARELYALATRNKVQEVVVKMMRPQKAARAIFTRLGFREILMLPDYVKDLHGKRQDLIVMRCPLEALLKEMEDYFRNGDFRRAR